LAHHHPNRVKRLVLMGSVGISFPITEGLYKVWGYQPSLSAMRELVGIFAHDHSIISDDLVQMRYQASNREGVAARFARLFPAPRQEGVERLALKEPELRRITAPVALIHGRNDRVIPFAVSERLAQVLPNATLHAMDACGHWVQIERREAFVRIVRNVLTDASMQKHRIEGRWMIESWRQVYDDGRVVLPLGEHVTGFAEYREGRVTIMLARADRARFTTGGQWDASQQEKARAYETGLFYAGRFSIEGDTVLHQIEIASYPNWAGSTQKRRMVLQGGDTLHLVARLEDGTPEARSAILQWRRAVEI